MFVSMDGERSTATVFSPIIGQAAASLVPHEAQEGKSVVLPASAAVSPRDGAGDDRGNQFHPITRARDKAPAMAICRPAW